MRVLAAPPEKGAPQRVNAPRWDDSEAGPCARETVEHSELSGGGLEVLARP